MQQFEESFGKTLESGIVHRLDSAATFKTIPLLDLKAQYATLQPEIDTVVTDVLASGTFILGTNVRAFEQEMASFIGVDHAIGVASGTDALVLSLRAIGIGPGDEVIIPAFTFFASGGAVLLLGATPILVDVDPVT